MTSVKTLPVRIDAVDLQDHTYKISTEKDLAGLAGSIQKIGLIIPPLLLRKKKTYRVVSGFRRVAACRTVKLQRIDARILEEGISPLKCAQFAIAENSFQRDLNPVELSRALNLMDRVGAPSFEQEAAAGSLGLPSNPSLVRKLKKIQGMPPLLQQGIVENQIALNVALKLHVLKTEDCLALSKLFLDLRISHSNQKELLTNMMETAARDDLRLSSILVSTAFQDILKDADLDRNQKTGRLRTYLKEKRYPHLYAAEKQFAAALQAIKLGDGMILRPAEYFEGSNLNLQISFKDLNELHRQLAILNQELMKPNLSKLIQSS